MGSTRKETFHMLKKKKIKFPKVCAYKNQLWKGQMFHNNEHGSCFWIAQTPLWRNRIIIAAPKVQVDYSLSHLHMVCGKFSHGSGEGRGRGGGGGRGSAALSEVATSLVQPEWALKPSVTYWALLSWPLCLLNPSPHPTSPTVSFLLHASLEILTILYFQSISSKH